MPKDRNRLSNLTLYHSAPSFNKGDRLSVKVASLRCAAENTPENDTYYTPDRRRCSPHRRSLGGRGREWASESLKLLEALLELDDSKPVREPVNPLKFPEFYSKVSNPLDLSKIMLKFHGGSYATLESFYRDMRSMFNSYTSFFKEANLEIYTQVHRLSWWFERELKRIDDKWGKTKKLQLSPYPTEVPPESASISKSTDAESTGPAVVPMYPVVSGAQTILTPQGLYIKAPQPGGEGAQRRKRKRTKDQILHQEHKQPQSEDPESESYTESPSTATCDTAASRLSSHRPQPPSHSRASSTGLSRQPNILRRRMESEPYPVSLARLRPETVAQLLRTKRTGSSNSSLPNLELLQSELLEATESQSAKADRTTTKSGPERSSNSRIPRLNLDVLSLQMSVSNIWFGTARIKPKKQALLSETGLQLSLQHGEQEIPFTVHADEIVRCVAHFGKTSQKHTLFLFVMPTCSKRLETINERYSNASMIVVFINASSLAQISSLIHIFWCIGQKSIFGPLFSEVDQQGALSLLGNIKPGIMNRVASKFKASLPHPEMDTDTNNKPSRTSETVSQRKRTVSTDDPQDHDKGVFDTAVVNGGLDVIPGSDSPMATEPESSVMPDSSMSHEAEPEQGTSCQAADNEGTNANSEGGGLVNQRFDKDFAERLGASLQQGFKDGFTEVLKNLADTLYGKTPPPVSTPREEDAEQPNAAKTDAQPDDESDIEIVIPTDSEDEGNKSPAREHDADVIPSAEEDLAVTAEKPKIRCPITQQIMTHPLKNQNCNHCYDKQGVEELIRNRKDKARCPVAGCSNTIPLHMHDMVFARSIHQYIQSRHSQTQDSDVASEGGASAKNENTVE